MSEMRVLTVRQPWATAIIHLGKDVENRRRNIAGNYRGPVAIHAGLAADPGARFPDVVFEHGGLPNVMGAPLPFGAIIGVVDLVDVHENDSAACYDCSEWAEVAWHLVLANPRLLTRPILFRGALGLRRLDDSTRLLVESELAS